MIQITPEQSRGARGFLNWSQTKLAKSAKVSLSTIADFENGYRMPRVENLEAIYHALERAGVEFIPENGGGPGARLRKRRRQSKLMPRRNRNALLS
jgi:transcriptional regulator with XRE-family HTH domain